jgi:hypothetical protein
MSVLLIYVSVKLGYTYSVIEIVCFLLQYDVGLIRATRYVCWLRHFAAGI